MSIGDVRWPYWDTGVNVCRYSPGGCPTPSSRNSPFWPSRVRLPSCGPPREMAVRSASSPHTQREPALGAQNQLSPAALSASHSIRRLTNRGGGTQIPSPLLTAHPKIELERAAAGSFLVARSAVHS